MPGIRAEAVCRRLPDAFGTDCPTCGHLRRWLGVRVNVGRRHIGELITEWCDHCLDEETP